MQLYPHQETAVLALRTAKTFLLADEPRVGKTAPTILAARSLGLTDILIVTPVSVVPVWKMELKRWWPDHPPTVQIVPWSQLKTPKSRLLYIQRYELLVLDESHYAKRFSAARTKAVYGDRPGGVGLAHRAERVWCLTGTPIPHDPTDLYPMLRTLMPEVLSQNGFPNVMKEDDFNYRYAVTVMKSIGHYGRKIPVVVGGKNETELRARIQGRMLRRQQHEVGIRPPINDLLPISITRLQRRQVDGDIDRATVLAAAEAGSTSELELHLGRLRHITGDIKAHGIAQAARDFFERMPSEEKLVIMYWHRSAGDTLFEELQKFMPLRLDGATPGHLRGGIVAAFKLPKHRVFLGQIEASGEGIDLSAASELWFAESVFSPKSMKQASLRIANLNQPKQTLVRVATLEGSIDEAVQARLIKLWATINIVLGDK